MSKQKPSKPSKKAKKALASRKGVPVTFTISTHVETTEELLAVSAWLINAAHQSWVAPWHLDVKPAGDQGELSSVALVFSQPVYDVHSYMYPIEGAWGLHAVEHILMETNDGVTPSWGTSAEQSI